ncbi:PQ loop repeat-domain-containing protein [Glomus cerebriforme]|uniref:PQ loop repeat-domain-containing protein n=1 Tax=Glomus cerebriforme TaxID=658196 RepID=A0A397SSQ3_9GLOM|nr:PQ loop repeat-domain-containing protein [Glomus cerebriforme]
MKQVIPNYFNILENVFGMIGTVLWSFQLIPQAHKNWRTKSTRGLARTMFLLWTLASVFFGIYAIILNLSIPLLIQPQLFAIIALFVYIQCFYYDSSKFKNNKIKSGILFVIISVLLTGVEVGAVYGIRYANSKDINWPETIIGIIPVVLLIIGFVPQYIEIFQAKRVIGISLIFMALDMSGALFSVLSLSKFFVHFHFF